jgi:hypothetical protein
MPAGKTYTPLARTTLSSAAATVTFSNISGSYTDLILVINHKGTGTSNICFRLNGDSSTNYSRTSINGDGSSVASYRSSNDNLGYIGVATTSFGNTIMHFNNYSNTTTYKTVLATTYQSNDSVISRVNLWRSTSAINQISLVSGPTYDIGSTFTLYGILAA